MSIDPSETTPEYSGSCEPATLAMGPAEDDSIGYECADPALCAPGWSEHGDASRPARTLR
jgi:hypothetical protein